VKGQVLGKRKRGHETGGGLRGDVRLRGVGET